MVLDRYRQPPTHAGFNRDRPMHDQLVNAVIYLIAAVIAVPLFERFRIGAILGYLVAGVVIGPFGLAVISNPADTLHLAELGVVLLLFLIGLELSPQALWRMRNWVLVLGTTQLLGTAAIIVTVFSLLAITEPTIALVIGLAVALSSTAFAVRLMTDYRILNTQLGQKGFAILLLQDLAVIPILLLVRALAGSEGGSTADWLIGVGAIIVVLLVGKYLINPLLRLVANFGSTELMTAAALLIVLGTALIIEAAGLSMGMGAFIAGILLANSSFRHQLESEIAPFKGLLLGLFFIAIGMTLDLSLLLQQPLLIIGAAIALIAIKTSIIAALAKLSGSSGHDAVRIGLMLSQGGEFAFVVMTQVQGFDLAPAELVNTVSMVVGISMALTSPLIVLYNRFLVPAGVPAAHYDSVWAESEPAVIIAGFGRIGQITGRILAANGIPFTALDKDAEHIEFMRRFGNKVFFGDATRLPLLELAGLRHAKVLMIALQSEADAEAIIQLARQECPNLKIISRAHNRATLLQQRKLGADAAYREMFGSSVAMAKSVLLGIGYSEERSTNLTSLFVSHDEALIEEALKHPLEVEKLIEIGNQGKKELELLFKRDQGNIDQKS